MIPPPRHRAFIVVMAVLIVLVAARWPHAMVQYHTRAATSPVPPRTGLATPGAGPTVAGTRTPRSSPVPQASATAGVPTPGLRWRAPLAGPLVIGRGFEPPMTPYGPGHRGVDLVGAPGTDVHAAGPGTVSFAGMIAGRGVITISHGSLRTTYEPVTPVVTNGQPVAAGEIIGHLVPGHPGCPAEACLHWGLLDGSWYRNPLSLLLRGRPRLLPVS
jgi:murein DD-endopeptidase MepM/ murein hydrolase activator NlpD